jgi:hypothetical protein
VRPRRYPRRAGVEGELFPELVELLLHGWRGDGRQAPETDEGDPFRIFDYHDRELAALWRQHRAALMREWRRRGLDGQPWAAEQYDQQPSTRTT